MRETRVSCRGLVLLGALCLAAGLLTGQEPASNQNSAQAPTQTQTITKEQPGDANGFKEFTVRVGDYLTLRKNVEKKLPAMKNKEQLPEMITAHQQVLARKIREARLHSKRGDIFTPAAGEAFRHVIRAAFQDTHTSTARTVARQRDKATQIRFRVNEIYPDSVAETSFPAGLLQQLPVLPEELAYRIVGRDLILVDSKANLVVDVLHEALP